MRSIMGSVSRWARKQAKIIGGVGAGAVVGLAGVAVVSASIPDANGVIHSCYRPNNGSIKIIDSATSGCTGTETGLNWNVTGPQGPAGPAGAAGATGPQGPAGPAGTGGDVLIPNLVGADLRGAVMVGWNLSGKNFTNANLSRARLSGSNLSGANFTGATFIRTQFEGANLTGANLTNTTYRRVNFADGNFAGATMNGAVFDSNFSGTTDPAGNNSGGNFAGANLTGATFSASWFGSEDADNPAVFYNPNFAGANFTNAAFTPPDGFTSALQFFNADFSNANFTGVQFNGTASRNVVFDSSNLNGTDLSALDTTYVAFGNNTTCPDGTNSGANGNTCAGHLAP